MGPLALEVRAGHKAYSGHDVLKDLNLPVERGRTLAILGASGSGKSTLLRVLAGLEDLDGGELVNGTPGGGRASTGVVFQRPLLLPWSDVRANVELGLRYRANRGRGDGRTVDHFLDLLGVDALARSLPDQLSGGQAQRVALARALVVRPEVLLLDEPFGALDPLTREALQDRLRDVAAELNLTVVIVTHDVSEALYLGDRIALLDGGGSAGHWWDGAPGDREADRVGALRDEILGRYDRPLPVRERTP